ncbi:Oidioi.mRNA.OKI2018_I69.chr1.g513.t1.cds [Oikopleura dioica]|uniref:Oidioi.mRNA.OKI2018_I69.chr1.g513.t1.cds n=1 Tax=Oikopleura dioica TaxID=34765 RepID=A0ABN7SK35_OIKDI|nr:Oidioi.mRNA.OKI2018_I69.chr1.g513.t1.cds [Oikopleura dioica]
MGILKPRNYFQVIIVFCVIVGAYLVISNSGNSITSQVAAGRISLEKFSLDAGKIKKENKKENKQLNMLNLLKTYREYCSKSKLTKTLKNRASTLEGVSKGGVKFSTCVTAKSASTALTQMFLEITGFIKDPIGVKFNGGLKLIRHFTFI